MGKKKRSEKPMSAPPPAPPPVKGPPSQINLRVEPEELQEIKRFAKATERSVVAFCRIAVRELIKRLKEEEGLK
jgi:hypothetical protein